MDDFWSLRSGFGGATFFLNCIFAHQHWELEPGTWNLEPGIWNLELSNSLIISALGSFVLLLLLVEF
jgi:hypothetical protein